MLIRSSDCLDGLFFKTGLLEDLQGVGFADVIETSVAEDHLHRNDRGVFVAEFDDLFRDCRGNCLVQADRQCAHAHDVNRICAELFFLDRESQGEIAFQQDFIQQIIGRTVGKHVVDRFVEIVFQRFGVRVPRQQIAGIELEDLESIFKSCRQ